MTQPYPIVEQRNLAPVPARRLIGPKRTRVVAEIPTTQSSHRLVYRIDGEYVLDNGALPLDSASVIDATHVSVVDVASDVEVIVGLDIPSKDADKFTMHLTFVCTVNDPIAVVRYGAPSAATALRAYIKGHHRIFELGLDYPLSEINLARRKLNAQVKAFTTVEPPGIIGMSVELASVEVLTPKEMTDFELSVRQEEQKHRIEFDRQRHEQVRNNDKSEFEHATAAEKLRAELELDADRRGYERYQFAEQTKAVPTDPISVMTHAYASGDITAKELADRVLKYDTDKQELARQEEREREERDRMDRREELKWRRETKRLKWEARRADASEKWSYNRRELEIRREEQQQDREWQREDLALDRSDKRRELEAKIEIIRELAQRGYLDTANVNLEKVVNSMLSAQGEAADGSAELTELAPAELDAAENEASDSSDDVEVREEDVH